MLNWTEAAVQIFLPAVCLSSLCCGENLKRENKNLSATSDSIKAVQLSSDPHTFTQQQSGPGVLTRHTAAAHLHVLGDEDLACLLDHRLRLQLLGGELAFPGVEHFLAGHAGQSQVCRVGLVGQGHLDGLWVDGAGGVPG